MLEAPALSYPEKNLPWMNTLAYFALLSVTKKKRFITVTPVGQRGCQLLPERRGYGLRVSQPNLIIL